MRVEECDFENYLKELDNAQNFINECKEFTKELQKYAFSAGWELDDEFLTVPNFPTPVVQKVCVELLKKSPKDVSQWYRKKLIKF